MKDLKLIVENDFHGYEILVEKENNHTESQIKVVGPSIVCGEENANGRVYSESMMIPVVDTFMQEIVQARRAFGELEHPPSTEIDLKNACHIVESLTKEGNIWIGEYTIMNTTPNRKFIGTPNGDILAAVIMAGGKIGMSTRGVGVVNGKDVDDFSLVTIDAVANPSGPGCFVDGIFESASFMIDTHGRIMEKAMVNFNKKLATKYPRTAIIETKQKFLDQLFIDLINETRR